jgi:hypothetical protein
MMTYVTVPATIDLTGGDAGRPYRHHIAAHAAAGDALHVPTRQRRAVTWTRRSL